MTKLACAPPYPHPPRVGRSLTGQSIRMSDLLICSRPEPVSIQPSQVINWEVSQGPHQYLGTHHLLGQCARLLACSPSRRASPPASNHTKQRSAEERRRCFNLSLMS